jgi:hypothetical protein
VSRDTFLAAAATYHYTAAVHEQRRQAEEIEHTAKILADGENSGAGMSAAEDPLPLSAETLHELTVPATFQVCV